MKRKMKLPAAKRTLYCLLFICLAAVILLSSQSQATPTFSAEYQTSNVGHPDNGNVQVTFSVRVYNNGTSDVKAGKLSVVNPAASQSYGSFSNVSVAAAGNVLVTGSLTVPQSIYDSWQRGATPLLNLDYTDTQGNSIHQVFPANLVPAGVPL